MKYFICRFTGAGKSYLLKELENSHQLPNFQFFDLDLMIDQEYAIKYRNLADFINTVGFC